MSTLDKIYQKLLHHLIETDQNAHTYDLSDYTTPRKPDATLGTPNRGSSSNEKDGSTPNATPKSTMPPFYRRTQTKSGSKSMWDPQEYRPYPGPRL